MDAKRLLAEATAETLRADAEYLKGIAAHEWENIPDRVRLLRLAALAEAVAVMSERAEHSLAKSADVVVPSWWAGDNGALRWSLWPADYPEKPRTLPAALSTLLPAEDTTDGR